MLSLINVWNIFLQTEGLSYILCLLWRTQLTLLINSRIAWYPETDCIIHGLYFKILLFSHEKRKQTQNKGNNSGGRKGIYRCLSPLIYQIPYAFCIEWAMLVVYFVINILYSLTNWQNRMCRKRCSELGKRSCPAWIIWEQES